MRLFILVVSLIYTINLADASQQALLRLQWSQIEAQKDLMSDNEKYLRVQALSSLFQVDQNNRTDLSQPIAAMISNAKANEAELAYMKWSMLDKLGFTADEFRMFYLHQQGQNVVALIHYGIEHTAVFTRDQILSEASFMRQYADDWTILSVVDPNTVRFSRTQTRSFASAGGDSQFL